MSGGLINQPELYESTNITEIQKERLRITTDDFIMGKNYDRIDVSYPSAKVEVFVYSLNATTTRTTTITYDDNQKTELLSVVLS